jgi:hypothetical protein
VTWDLITHRRLLVHLAIAELPTKPMTILDV